MVRLSAEQIDQLTRLLTPAMNVDLLDRMVHLGTGDRLFEAYVGPGDPLKMTIRKLLLALEGLRITDQFLRVVYREHKFDAEMRALIGQFYPDIPQAEGVAARQFSVQVGGVAQPEMEGAGPGLQRNIKPALKQLDLGIWLARLGAIEGQVCRIEADQTAFGTGFLVGKSAVLTNWHVVDFARKRGVAGPLTCRFGFKKRLNGGVDGGRLVTVNRIVDESRCSPAELTRNPDVPPPEAGELDYALLELSEAAGEERGFVAMTTAPVAADDPLVIVQHPKGEPIRFAVDTSAVIRLVHDGLRLRYRTNTEPGSSGSPCFTMDLDLVALHHLGDPSVAEPVFNQGVPIELVRASIAARGHGALLG